MKNPDHLSPRDLERLSAYLDGECSSKEAAKLEARLQVEPRLRQALEELRATVGLMRALPEVPPPRSFALTPEMVGVKQRRAYPALRLATALASIAFVTLIGLDALTTVIMPLAGALPAAPAMRDVGPPEAGAVEEPLMEAEAPVAEIQTTEEPEGILGQEQDAADLMQMATECAERSQGFAGPNEGEAAVEDVPKCMGKFAGILAPSMGTELPEPTLLPEPTATETLAGAEPLEEASERGLGVLDWPYWRMGLRASEIFFGVAALVLASLMLWTRRK